MMKQDSLHEYNIMHAYNYTDMNSYTTIHRLRRWGQPGCAPNTYRGTPMHIRVFTTFPPQKMCVCRPIFLTSLRQCEYTWTNTGNIPYRHPFIDRPLPT